jgi:hypothetical protein
VNQEIRDMVGSALHDEPPLGIDRARVVRSGRRRLRARRAGLAGGAALGVVAAVLAAVTVAGGQAPSEELATGVSSTGSATAATPAPKGVGCPGRPNAADVPRGGPPGTAPAARPVTADPAALAEAGRLTQAFSRFAIPAPAGVTVPNAVFCAREPGYGWHAEVVLKAPWGERTVYLDVRPRGGQPPGECATFGGAVTCTTQTLSDGTALRIDEGPPVEPTQPVLFTVTAWRSDGTVVSVMETGTMGPEGKPATPRVLDTDALIKIATAPELKTEWTGPVTKSAAEPSDRRAAELTAVIEQAGVLPAGMRADGGLRFVVSQGGYKLDADLTDAAGEGHLFVNVSAPARGGSSAPTCEGLEASHHPGVEVNCQQIKLPNGRDAIVVRETSTGADSGVMAVSLHAAAEDGTGLYVSVRNTSNRALGQGKNAPRQGPTRPEPPLDVDALARIAALPGLHW